MPYPQLFGRIDPTKPFTVQPLLLAVVLLAVALAALAWRMRPAPTVSPATPAPVVSTVSAVAPPTLAGETGRPAPDPHDDQLLHMVRAQQELRTAAEQLAAARRQLASLGQELDRNYLSFERQRAESASTACNTAQRAIESAIVELRIASTRERK